jgi:hypothetical protein
LKQNNDELLSSLAFKFNLRRCTLAVQKHRCELMRAKVRKCDAQIAGKLAKGFDSVCAFVTFEAGAYTRSLFSLT